MINSERVKELKKCLRQIANADYLPNDCISYTECQEILDYIDYLENMYKKAELFNKLEKYVNFAEFYLEKEVDINTLHLIKNKIIELKVLEN